MKMNTPKKISLLDINESAFHNYHDPENECEIELKGSTAFFIFKANDKFFELQQRYSNDEPVPILSFVRVLRNLKAQMYQAKKNGNGGNNHAKNLHEQKSSRM